MGEKKVKSVTLYRILFRSQRRNGEVLQFDRFFAFEQEMTEEQIKNILFTRLDRIVSIKYIYLVEQDVLCW